METVVILGGGSEEEGGCNGQIKDVVSVSDPRGVEGGGVFWLRGDAIR